MAVTVPRTVLVLRALGLGDLLTAVPALRALRRAYPGSRITLAAPQALAELVKLTGAVDRLHPTAEPESFAPDGQRAELAVNLHGSGPQSIETLQNSGALRVLTHTHPAHPDLEGPRWIDDQHEVERWCRMLGWFGIRADPGDLRLPTPESPSAEPAAVVLHPGASHVARQWPPWRYAQLARRLERSGRRVVVTGSAEEIGLAEQVAAHAGLPRCAVLAGRSSLGELAALVAHACLVVCGDTGVAHLATAFGTPSVVLFGPVSPAHWGPPSGGPHIALWTGNRGDTFADRPDPGLLELSVEQVAAAATTLLRRRQAPVVEEAR